jgi:predicted nucleic-acid-binding protein
MKLVDADVVLRFLAGEGSELDDKAHALLDSLDQTGETLILLHCVVFEVIYTLEKYYQAPRSKVADIMRQFIESPSLHVPRRHNILLALEKYAVSHFDLVDCYLAAEVELSSVEGIYSFDQEFDAMGVPRFEPGAKPGRSRG